MSSFLPIWLLLLLSPTSIRAMRDAASLVNAVYMHSDASADVHLIKVRSDRFSRQLAKELQEDHETPLAQTTTQFLSEYSMMEGKKQCPLYFATRDQPSEEEELQKQGLNRGRFYSHEKYHSLYVVLAFGENDTSGALSALNGTIWNCTNQMIDLGVYNTEAQIVFLTDDETGNEMSIFSDPRVAAHPRIAVAQADETSKWTLYNKPFYLDQPQLTKIWKKGQDLLNLYPNLENMRGHTLRASVIPYDRVGLKNENGAFWGEATDLLELYLQKFNAKAFLIEEGKGFGYLGPMRWSGERGLVYSNSVDFALSSYPNNFKYTKIFAISLHSFYHDGVAMAVPLPAELPKALAIVFPFQLPVWLAILGSVGIVAISLWLLNLLLKKALKALWSRKFERLANVLWFCLGALRGEDVMDALHTSLNNTLKCLVGAWITATMILLAAYAGSIKSFLINPGHYGSIDSLEDLLHQELFRIVSMSYGPTSHEVYTKHPDLRVRELFEKIDMMDYVYNFEKIHLKKVFKGQHILFSIHSTLNFLLETLYTTPSGKHLVHLANLPEVRNFQNFWIFHKLNPFSNHMDNFLKKLNDFGIMDQTRQRVDREVKWLNVMSGEYKFAQLEDKAQNLAALTLNDLQGAFLFSLPLLLLSLFVFFIEIWCSRRGESKGDGIKVSKETKENEMSNQGIAEGEEEECQGNGKPIKSIEKGRGERKNGWTMKHP